MVSSVRDISDWQDALLSGSVLQPASLAQMLDFHPRSGYGLGMRYARLDGILGIGHGGSLRGFVALMYRLHRQDIDVVVLTNLGRTNIQGLADKLTHVAMNHYAIPRPPTLPALSAGRLARIAARVSRSMGRPVSRRRCGRPGGAAGPPARGPSRQAAGRPPGWRPPCVPGPARSR